jgi:hypothetical protein
MVQLSAISLEGGTEEAPKRVAGSTFNFIRGTPLVAQLVEALYYKPEGRGFDSRWCHWNFSLT